MTPFTSTPSTRRTLRSLLCKLLVLTMLLPLLTPSALATNVGSTLTVGIQSTKTQLIYPLDPKERDIVSVYDLIYERLVEIDDDYEPAPGIAQSWERSANGRIWTFKLRSNVKFSDGTPLTAQDCVATINYILTRAKDENSSERGYYQNLRYFVESASAKDDKTLIIKTTSDRGYMGLLYELNFPILPADRVASENPPGSGPYKIDAFQAGSYLQLGTNPYWWKNQPQVKSITFLMEETAKKVMEDYEYARVDTIFTRSVAAAQYTSGTSSLAMRYSTNQLECLLMNHSYTKLADPVVRKAIRLTVNVDALARNVYMGMVDRTNTPFANGTWMYNSSVDAAYTNNVEEAKRILEEAGWYDTDEDGALDKLTEDGTKLDLKLNLYVYEEPDDNVRVAAADMIADQLAEIGIVVTVTTLTMAGVQEKLSAGSFHLALVSYAMDTAPDYGFLLMSGNTGNYSRYRSSAMTNLCKELRSCKEKSDYQSKLYQIQAQFTDDCPFLCLYYRCGMVLTRKMYTTVRDVRELQLMRGVQDFSSGE